MLKRSFAVLAVALALLSAALTFTPSGVMDGHSVVCGGAGQTLHTLPADDRILWTTAPCP